MTNAATPTKKKGRPLARGDGSVYETAAGRWRAAITVTDAMGRPTRRYLSAATEREVRSRLSKARDVRRERSGTLGAWIETWLGTVRGRVRYATFVAYRGALDRHVAPLLGHLALSDLKPSQIEAMLGELVASKGLALTTVSGIRRSLVACLQDALRDGLLARNPASLARAPRGQAPRRRALTPDEVRTLLATDPGPLVILAITTGLRRGELVALAWVDIDLPGRRLHVRHGATRAARKGYVIAEPKTARSIRTLVLPALAVAALERQRDHQDLQREAAGEAWRETGLVLTSDDGRMVDPSIASRTFAEAAARAGLGRVRLHDGRHTAATIAILAGVPIPDVSRSLGHANAAITMAVYSHPSEHGAELVADAMDRALR